MRQYAFVIAGVALILTILAILFILKKSMRLYAIVIAGAALALAILFFAMQNNQKPMQYVKDEPAQTEDELVSFGYKASDYVKLESYGTLSLPETEKVGERDVYAEAVSRLKKAGLYKEKKSGNVGNGDTVNISCTATVGGKQMDELTFDGKDMYAGGNEFLDELQGQLTGKEIGGTFQTSISIPQSLSSKYAKSTAAELNVTVNLVKNAPELTPENIKAATGTFDDEGKYLVHVRECLEKKAEIESKNAAMKEFLMGLADTVQINDYPKELVPENPAENEEFLQEYALSAGIPENVVKIAKENNPNFTTMLEEYLKENAAQEMVIQYLAEQEGIQLYRDECDDLGEELKEIYGVTYKQSYIEKEALKLKVVDKLASKSS